jgi:hypothetical protein
MPQWTPRWLAWARDNLFRRARPRALSAAVGYERAGVTRWETPVPWAADAVVIDVLLSVPPAARRKTDFALRLPSATFPADALRPDADDRHRVTFRCPVPADPVGAALLWRGRTIATVPVNVLTPGRFLAGLALVHPVAAVRFGGATVSATAFVPDRCEALVAAGVLRCPTGLAPVGELGLRATFREETTGAVRVVAVALPAAQLARAETVVTAVSPDLPRAPGAWWITWSVGDRVLATHRVYALDADRFAAGVRVVETRFAVIDAGGAVRTAKAPPAVGGADRVGPCFVLAGCEPGAAAVCRFEVTGVAAGGFEPVLGGAAEAVITDAPTALVPALFGADQLARVSGFELRLSGRLLGVASLRPVPAAALDGEGGFAPPPDFAWSTAADDELADRLKRLSG